MPGTLTVIIGATGIGKTQLGIQFLNAGLTQEKSRGLILDFTARGDSQNHANYASRISQWPLSTFAPPPRDAIETLLASDQSADYLPIVVERGRNVRARK